LTKPLGVEMHPPLPPPNGVKGNENTKKEAMFVVQFKIKNNKTGW